MSNATRIIGLALAAGLAAMAAPASAQGYVGAGLGPSRIGIDCTGLTICNKTDTGGKAYIGFRMTPEFAVELTYFDWGTASGQTAAGAPSEVSPGTSAGSAEVKGDGVGVGVAYVAPFTSPWNGVARIGLARNRGKSNGSALGFSSTQIFHSTEGYVGLGVGYALTPALTLTGEFDVSRVKYTVSDKATTQLVTVGLRYLF